MKRLLFFLMPCIFFSCKKGPERPPQIATYFSLTTGCPRYMASDSLQYLDSNIVFVNYSDTGRSISYKWDFGDNNFSTQKNTVHSYNKPGTCRVKLYSLYNNKISDSFVRNLRIIVGQTAFKSAFNNSHPIDLDEGPEGGVIFISYASSPPYYNDMYYNITCSDSLLKRKWTKDLGTGVRLSSIKKINTGEYILSGNYNQGPTDQFCLSKINSNGNLLWQKYPGSIAGVNNYTLVTSDGNLLTIGTTSLSINRHNIIVKCDASGNEIWRKSFDGVSTAVSIRDADNIIETTDGYIFASLNSSNQIALTRIDYNGNIVKQTFTAANTTSTIFKTGVALAGNSIMVYATNSSYIYMFTNSLSFIDARAVAQSGINHGIAGNNHFYLAEGNHQYAFVDELSTEGTPGWSSKMDDVLPVNANCTAQRFGVSRYCNKIIYNSKGELVAAIEGQAAGGDGASFIAKYDVDGKLK